MGYTAPMKTKGLRVKRSKEPTIEKRTMTPRRSTNAAVRPREYLTTEEIRHLLKVARSRPGGYGHRDSTRILIAYRHGLRVSELVAMRWDMLDLKQGTFHVVRRKNGRPSVHLIRGDEIRALRRVAREQISGSPYVFVSERKGPMTVAAFRKLMTRIGAAAELPFPVQPAHAPARLRLQARQRRARHPRLAGVAGPQQHPAHDPVHRTHVEAVQKLLAGGGLKSGTRDLSCGWRRVLHHVGVQLILKIKPWNFPH